ncbi:YfiR family protein [Thiovibrio frasassiensis]|uniref:YfiR family protein n=1 Tax=Thiovibrio frasassiensis TaxID=2984131 RepID=A0A9X4RKZ5_9BACT|nr:YfiR family protein [Thiovibrio frasassiensis]MDG4475536.1 YfiR family protein [Thiovibrio frasassiensis]
MKPEILQKKSIPGRKRVFALFALLCLFCLPCDKASGANYEEYELKAGFLYNFFNFIKWPERSFDSAKSPFVLVIVGGGEKDRTIEHALQNSVIGARPLKVIVTSSAEDLDKAHMIFFMESYKNSDLPKILAQLQGKPVITVGEGKNFISLGGDINFVRKGAKIKFQINPAATEKGDLKISSRLLMLAVGPDQSAIEENRPIRVTAPNTMTSDLNQETTKEDGIL